MNVPRGTRGAQSKKDQLVLKKASTGYSVDAFAQVEFVWEPKLELVFFSELARNLRLPSSGEGQHFRQRYEIRGMPGCQSRHVLQFRAGSGGLKHGTSCVLKFANTQNEKSNIRSREESYDPGRSRTPTICALASGKEDNASPIGQLDLLALEPALLHESCLFIKCCCYEKHPASQLVPR